MSELLPAPRIAVQYACTPAEFSTGQSMLVTAEQQQANASAKWDKKGPSKTPQNPGQLKFGRGLFGWMLFVALSIMFFMLMRQGRTPGNAPPPRASMLEGVTHQPALYVMLVGGVAVIGGFTLLRLYVASTQKTRDIKTKYEISDAGVTITLPLQTSHWTWSRFHSFARNESVIVLRTSPRVGLILPVRLFTAEQIEQLTAFLNQRLIVKAPTLHGGFEVVQP